MEQKKVTVTGDILKEMAVVFWEKLPQYVGQEIPKFSTGYFDGFKARYSIKKYREHGESGFIALVVIEEKL